MPEERKQQAQVRPRRTLGGFVTGKEGQGVVGEKDLVRAQFGRNAEAYAASRAHASGPGLQQLLTLAAPAGTEELLDVSTGAGHTALTFAPHVRRVVACDLTPEMLDTARRLADRAGARNIEFAVADAEALPFPAASFDLVTCRIAAHHYPHPRLAVQEMARVLRPGGKLLIEDNYAPEPAIADRFINTLEKLRDPSHVRAWTMAEWAETLAAAGVQARVAATFTTPVEFDDWVARSQTPGEDVALLRSMLQTAPAPCQAIFRIESDPLRFVLHKAIWLAEKP